MFKIKVSSLITIFNTENSVFFLKPYENIYIVTLQSNKRNSKLEQL